MNFVAEIIGYGIIVIVGSLFTYVMLWLFIQHLAETDALKASIKEMSDYKIDLIMDLNKAKSNIIDLQNQLKDLTESKKDGSIDL